MATAIEGNNIYVKSQDESIWTADMSKNLIDPSNWTQTSSAPSFDVDETDYNNNIELVKTLQPGGPDYNEFYESKFINGKLYTTGGAFLSGQINKNNPGIIQILNGNNWTVYPTNISETTGISYKNVKNILSVIQEEFHTDAITSYHSCFGDRCIGCWKLYYDTIFT